MKKPAHGITLATADYDLDRAANGETFNPEYIRKCREVVRYWQFVRAKKAAKAA